MLLIQSGNAGDDFSVGVRPASGQFSNNYVRGLMEAKLAEIEERMLQYQEQVNSMRVKGNGDVAEDASDPSTEDGEKSRLAMLLDFEKMKKENLELMLGRMEVLKS